MATREVRSGTISIAPLSRLTTARGSGLPCDECHQPIEPMHVECRCATSEGASPLRFHQWCYYTRLRGDQRGSAP